MIKIAIEFEYYKKIIEYIKFDRRTCDIICLNIAAGGLGMERVMVIGGHSGDEAIMAGTIAAKTVRNGGSCLFVSLTNGDGGHPKLSREQYAIQKNREAENAAKVLGAECVLWQISSKMLEATNENAVKLASVVREYKPDTVITHWKNSLNKDHAATYYIVEKALSLAIDCKFEDGNMPIEYPQVFYGDNWEDADGFVPDIYALAEKQDEEKWLEACNCFEFFRESFYKFNYKGYYMALHRMRGALAGRKISELHSGIAVGLMRQPKTAYQADIIF